MSVVFTSPSNCHTGHDDSLIIGLSSSRGQQTSDFLYDLCHIKVHSTFSASERDKYPKLCHTVLC